MTAGRVGQLFRALGNTLPTATAVIEWLGRRAIARLVENGRD